jgi:hypothetical protein
LKHFKAKSVPDNQYSKLSSSGQLKELRRLKNELANTLKTVLHFKEKEKGGFI